VVKLILSIIVTSILVSPTSYAKGQKKKFLKLNPDRTIHIVGPIKNLRSQSKRILKLSENNQKPIYVTIDSYGGSVLGGVEFIQAMDRVRSRGVRVKCVVTGASMSMATHILAACSNRYALPTSLIMWHPMAINVAFARLTEVNTEQMNEQLRLLSRYLDVRLRDSLAISEAKYRKFEKGEYIMFGADIKKRVAPDFLSIIEDVR
jgi:ATP-dependent protease ClpP protease subunit